MGCIDFAGINGAAMASFENLLEAWLPEGQWAGQEYVSRNPTRADSRPGSFKINRRGMWEDFATGDNGSDPISLFAYLFCSDDQGKAAKQLADEMGCSRSSQAEYRDRREPKPEAQDSLEAIRPVPAEAPPPPDEFRRLEAGEWIGLPVVARWAYRDISGQVIGYASRIELPDGGKDVLCQQYMVDRETGEIRWRWRGFAKPRPLYNLHRLAADPDANVVIVEGEKTADAAQALLPDVVVVTWPGGGKAVQHVDWQPLAGRKIVLLPDADLAGYGAMEGYVKNGRSRDGIAQILEPVCRGTIRVCDPPEDAPDGWDLADVDWTADQAWDFLTGNLREPGPPHDYSDPPDMPAPPDDDLPPAPADDGPPLEPMDPEPADTVFSRAPFRILGQDRGIYYYLPSGTRQVLALTASGHGKANLMVLAPLQWWERAFPGRSGASWDMAANALFRSADRLPPFSPDSVRGRGAWWDDGVPIMHLGDRVIIDGVEHDIEGLRSRYIYEQAPAWTADLSNPLTNGEAHALVDLLQQPCWEKPINGLLLSGWLVSAMICGALDWRPHLWLTGGSGTGKSWLIRNVIERVLAGVKLQVQGATTEAGIRQALGHDARPVLFDEFEISNQAAKLRIEGVMELMRQASSENGAVIVKGSANGLSQSFRIRSTFLFSSVAVAAKQFADLNRVSVLGLTKDQRIDGSDKFQAMAAAARDLLTPDYARRLHARCYQLIPAIRANADRFAVASAEAIGSQRAGDQIGILLAGAYALHSTRVISDSEARDWVNGQDWSDERNINDQRDEEQLLSFLMARVLEVNGIDFNGRTTRARRTVGQLVRVAADLKIDAAVSRETADDELRLIGLRVLPDGTLAIANTHDALDRILRDTPWSANWGKILQRHDLVSASATPVRMNPGVKSRASLVPVSLIADGE